MPHPRIFVIRGSGDLERLQELAHRQLRLAVGLEQEIDAGGLSPGAIAEVTFRARRHRKEHERLAAAARAFEDGKTVEVDLNAEASA